MSANKSYKTTDFISATLARWAAGLQYEHLSPAAIRTAKLFWYDSLGCALGGSQQEDAHILLEHARRMRGSKAGSGKCTLLVSGFRTDPVEAALLNSHMIRAMDYNDIYWKADPCHPSDIIAGPLALAEARGLSGKDVIVATIIAYEIEMRLCEAGIPGIREYGWHHATLTGFAAPIAAGRILGLSAERIQQAIGISASRTCTLGAVTAGKLTNMKNTVDPMATRAGVESALLAELGYSGPEHVIDGKEGVFHVFGHEWDTSKLTDDLPTSPGDHYRILDCGMKSFPIEALSHAPLTAMLKVVKENSIRPDDVAEIKVEVIARAADILGDPHKYRPNSKETADHSLPYCLAVGLLDGMVTPLQFKDERIKDPALIPVMDKVKVVANQEFEAMFPRFQPSRVTITTTSGRAFSKQVDVPKGDPRDPMTEEEIGVKFMALGRDVMGAERCRDLGKAIMSMEALKTVAPLMRLLVAPARGARAVARSNGYLKGARKPTTRKTAKKAAGRASSRKPARRR
jgi:2-methylcitrate dehydratase